MTALDKVKSLFTAQETVVESPVSYPDESQPGYWDDDSINVTYDPPVTGTQDHWAPTADQVVPGYRGVEEHGVPYDGTNQYIIPVDASVIAEKTAGDNANDGAETIVTEVPIAPIPVNVVSMPDPVGVERRYATSNYPLNNTDSDATRVAPKNLQRSRLRIAVSGADTVFLSADKQQAKSGNGFLLTASMGLLELKTSKAVYAFASSATATIYLIDEFTTEVQEYVE